LELPYSQIVVNRDGCSQKLMFYCVFGPRIINLLWFWSSHLARSAQRARVAFIS
jgi:hypothetical protein